MICLPSGAIFLFSGSIIFYTFVRSSLTHASSRGVLCYEMRRKWRCGAPYIISSRRDVSRLAQQSRQGLRLGIADRMAALIYTLLNCGQHRPCPAKYGVTEYGVRVRGIQLKGNVLKKFRHCEASERSARLARC